MTPVAKENIAKVGKHFLCVIFKQKNVDIKSHESLKTKSSREFKVT